MTHRYIVLAQRSALHLVSMVAIAAAGGGCKQGGSPMASSIKSGFEGADCASIYANYKLQKTKLDDLKTHYIDAWKDYRTANKFDPDPFAPTAAPDAGGGAGSGGASGSGGGTPVAPPVAPQSSPDSVAPSGDASGDTANLADENAGAVAPQMPESLQAPASAPTPGDDKPPTRLEEINLNLPEALVKHPKFADNANKCLDLYKSDAQPLYQKCTEFFTTLNKVNGIVDNYNNSPERRDCREGGGSQNIVPQLYAYCDAACTFSPTVECTRCNITYKNPVGLAGKEPVVCLGHYGAKEAAGSFCKKMSEHNFSDCKIESCETKKGSEFAGASTGTQVAGSNLKIDEKALSAYAQVEAGVTLSAGVYADAQTSVRGTVGGSIVMKQMNAGDSILTESGLCRSESKFVCEIHVRQIIGASASIAAGAGGSFKVFGNGVDAKAAVRAGGDISWSVDAVRSTEPIACSGLSKNLMFDQCYAYLVGWAKNDLSSQFEGIRDKVQTAVDQMIKATVEKRSMEAAQEQARSDQWYESGKQKGDSVYSDRKTIVSWTACYKYDSGWGMSGEGQTDCNNAASGQGDYKDRYRQGCYDQVSYRCKNG